VRGVVSATSVDTGKLIVVETLIKYCQGCENVKDNEKNESNIEIMMHVL
jgi:hypothetical protein